MSFLVKLALDKAERTIPPTTLFTLLATCRHLFDRQLFTKLIHASASLPIRDRKYFLLALATNPNIDLANLKIILELFQKSQAKSAAANYKVVQRYYLEKENTPAYIITSDWATLTDQVQMDFINEYLETTSSLYPTLQQPRFHRPAPGFSDPPQKDLTALYLTPGPLTGNLLSNQITRITTTLTSPLIFQDLVAPLLDPRRQPGYDLFFALAVGWSATVADLIEVVTSTLTQ